MALYAEVAVNRPVNQTFHYHIPPALTGNIQPGHMVAVSWGTALMTGVVLALSDDSPVPETKPIRRRLDPDPVLTPLQIDLAWWLARHTLVGLAMIRHVSHGIAHLTKQFCDKIFGSHGLYAPLLV